MHTVTGMGLWVRSLEKFAWIKTLGMLFPNKDSVIGRDVVRICVKLAFVGIYAWTPMMFDMPEKMKRANTAVDLTCRCGNEYLCTEVFKVLTA
jgi:hypothetical protein